MKNLKWWLTGLVTLGVILVLLLVVRSEYNALQDDYEALQQQNETLQADNAELNTKYTAVNDELAEIRKVYPARDFSSVDELENWLALNDVSELPPVDIFDAELNYSRALKLQADALKDGYIISVDIDVISYDLAYIACVAIIDGDFWWWFPETDEPYKYTGLGKVARD